MSKIDELMRTSKDIAAESMGRVRTTAMHGASATAPDRLQGIIRSKSAAEIPVAKIGPDPDQPRTEFKHEDLERLAESMKRRGQLQPIRVRWDESRAQYIIVCGERRWRAAELGGLPTMSCVIMEGPVEPGELLALQLIENCVREDLRPIEQARAFRSLMDRNGWSTRDLGRELSITQSAVVRALALLELPESLQARVEEGTLPPATAYEISKARDVETIQEVAAEVLAEGLTRAEAVDRVRQASKSSKGRGQKGRAPRPRVFRLAGMGKVTIEPTKNADLLAMAREVVRVLEQEQGSQVAA